jgi:hypothetical protein
MRRFASASLLVLVLGCSSDDGGGDPVAQSTGTTAAGSSESGEVDHGTAHPHDDDGGTAAPTGTSSADDDTGPAGDTTAAESGSTGAVAMDTWENWALPEFFEVYCNECHPSDQSTRDFSMYETVVANEEHIRCGVAPEAIRSCDPGHIEPGHLPIGPGPYPSDDERWRLVDWVLAGMPRD